MAKGSRYKVPRKRRREGKTNYYKRYRMIISGQKLRAVIRKTGRQIIVQIIEFSPSGDRTIAAAVSKELRKFGWLGDLHNTPASYLTGLLAGLKARKTGIKFAVPDIGLHPSIKGSRVYAAIRGLNDAGIKVPASPDIFPNEERILGKHISAYASKLQEVNPDLYRRLFAGIISRGLKPENISEHFEEVKSKILSSFQEGES